MNNQINDDEKLEQCIRCKCDFWPDDLDADMMCEVCAREYYEEINR